MEQKLAAQRKEMQRLATVNHRFALTETSLRQELAAARQELERLHIHFGAITFERLREQQLKTILEKITKMEADLKDSEHVKGELQHASAEAQSLVVERQKLVSRIEPLSQEFQKSHGDLQQISVMKSELDTLRQDYQHWRATYNYESKLRSDRYESLQVAPNHLISILKEVEELQAALLNATNIDRSGGQPGANAASYNGTEPPGSHPAGQNAYGCDAPRGFASDSSRYAGYDAARIDNIEVPVTCGHGFPGGASVAQGAVDTGNSATLYGSVQTESYGSAGAPSTLGSTQAAAYRSEQSPAAHGSTHQASYGSEQNPAAYGSTQQAAYGSGQAPEAYGYHSKQRSCC